ncbi:hypothetical protein J4E86_002040 [Alternaria arbusti]|uniref:uncharacterized protein n=1 Tax=Alternaria arbusti TaxID=232088 RepID=UPI002220FBBF|nr:uncharacterized protein J4E86_002040 [Alternaria arbusti]KAI4960418.1 hypothetical protein J4E86_002040 [Alternaria arbusti]
MAVKPITGMLRRQVVLDLSVAMGLGLTAGYGWWYGDATALPILRIFITPILTIQGYHVPAVRHRDAFYQKLEDERASSLGQK